jgi:hypothetical protein
MLKHFRCALALWVAAWAVGAGASHAQNARLEYAVKASFLYKLAAFVEWPPTSFPDASGPFKLCIVGSDPFGAQLEKATAGQRIANHPIVVRRFGRADQAAGCHVVYFADSDDQAVARALQGLRSRPVLTVTDEAFDDKGRGIIHFVVRDGRVRFQIDTQRASLAGLTLSSKLTSLAVAAPSSRGS